MVRGLLGKKVGMTQVWDDDGRLHPATVLEVGPCVVLQVRTVERDGYSAVQLGFEDKPVRRKHGKGERRRVTERRGATRAEMGHARAAGATPKRFVRDVRVAPDHGLEAGQELTVDALEGLTHVDVVGVTKGKGFQGTIRRHGFSRGPESHGSMNVREPGAIGQSADPSRVFPGARMSGHVGHERHTEHNVRVLQVDARRNVLVLGGAVPGPNGGYVQVLPAKRMAGKQNQA